MVTQPPVAVPTGAAVEPVVDPAVVPLAVLHEVTDEAEANFGFLDGMRGSAETDSVGSQPAK